MKVMCVFGKHQYGDPARGLGTEYAAFLPALTALGHQVIHFESWDRTCYKDFSKLNRALVDAVEREQPDVLLTVHMHYEIWLETIQLISSRGDVATISWTTDDSWKYREVSKFIGKYYHAMTTTYPYRITDYKNDGIENVLLTQWAANSESLKEPIPLNKCKYKVTFVGAAHGDRKIKIELLKSMGINVECFGYGWERGSLSECGMQDVINNSAISLNFANSKGDNQIKARTFEVPGAGGFLITEHSDGIDHYYDIGKEIIVVRNIKEMAIKIRYFFAHPDERDNIAHAGFVKTKTQHSYEVRMKDLIEFALNAKDRYKNNFKRKADWLFKNGIKDYKTNMFLKLFKIVIVSVCSIIWGKKRANRAARRILFEVSWRCVGGKTFSASGWCGRLFYKES